MLFYACLLDIFGSLPWVAVMVTAAWGGYAVSQAGYYNKSKAENITGGLVYEATMTKINNPDQDCD